MTILIVIIVHGSNIELPQNSFLRFVLCPKARSRRSYMKEALRLPFPIRKVIRGSQSRKVNKQFENDDDDCRSVSEVNDVTQRGARCVTGYFYAEFPRGIRSYDK